MIDVVVSRKEDAHHAAQRVYAFAQELIVAGKGCEIVAKEAEDDRTLRQNRFYWGVILREISEQATIEGQRWAADAWHELFKRQFLGFKISKVRVAGRKRAVVSRSLKSTREISVKAMSKFLEQVQAFAVTDLAVVFSLNEWEKYRG